MRPDHRVTLRSTSSTPVLPTELILQVVDSLVALSPSDATTRMLHSFLTVSKSVHSTDARLLCRHCLYIDSPVRLEKLLRTLGPNSEIDDKAGFFSSFAKQFLQCASLRHARLTALTFAIVVRSARYPYASLIVIVQAKRSTTKAALVPFSSTHFHISVRENICSSAL